MQTYLLFTKKKWHCDDYLFFRIELRLVMCSGFPQERPGSPRTEKRFELAGIVTVAVEHCNDAYRDMLQPFFVWFRKRKEGSLLAL